MSTKDIHENHEPASPLGLGSSEGLGPLVEAKRLVAHYQQHPQWFGGDEVDEVCRLIDAAVAAERERWSPLVAALTMAVRQNEHDMVMTGEELRACRAALDAFRA